MCPQFQVPVGTGIGGYGVIANLVEDNLIYDNWRRGFALIWVPAAVRGDNDPAKQYDTSNGNRIVRNVFGTAPDGKVLPNGVDVFWDEQGIGNCWSGNDGAGGKPLTSDLARLPTCDSGGSTSRTSNPEKSAGEVPCATWHPVENRDPPGCSWFTTPERPKPE